MNEITVEDEIKVEDMIYEIRGKQVMLDSDLAKLYECKNGTKTINLAVKRHINRFPDRFMFRLTENECENISKFQIETLKGRGHNIKYLPYVFTEEGVAMLATILRTEVAANVSSRIMDAFVAMRHYNGNNEYRLFNVEDKIIEHDKRIKLLEETFDKFDEKEKINEVYFNGQTYDAYSRIIDIMKKAKKEIIIIDSYVDKTILDMISKIDINVILVTRENSKLSKLDIDKYNNEYHNLEVIYNDTFHDRYIVIDNGIIYHIGASINHAGKRTFSINLLKDTFVIDNLYNKILEVINERNNG